MNFCLVALFAAIAATAAAPTAKDNQTNVSYIGTERNGIEVFLGIPYAQDTSGPNRFKPPVPVAVPAPGSVINATKPGLPCPQQLGMWNAPLTLQNTTAYSEDCLNLNIARPAQHQGLLPVLLWIHGGSFWVGSNMEPTFSPDGLILESVEGGTPVIHVAINYRLGFFGFAQSTALRNEKSENAALRDQRFAIEWVRDNIHIFGGDGNKITIAGQSSGGLAVGIQLLAYGGTQPLPYQQGIAQSQALEPGIVSADGELSFTQVAFRAVVDDIGCKVAADDYDSQLVIDCLRTKDTESLFNSSQATYTGDIAHNIGDIWLPSVDGDFLPAAPSQLLSTGKFGNATYMLGWTNDDVNFFTDVSIASDADAKAFINTYVPTLHAESPMLVDMYPVADFEPPAGKTNLTAQFYRAARVFRDILMVCEPLYMADALNRFGNKVYLYNWNQTILDPILASVYNVSNLGAVHTSEFAYIWGNLSAYDVEQYPFSPTAQDVQLMQRGSRTWSRFVSTGILGDEGRNDTLRGWRHAFWDSSDALSPAGSPGYPHVFTAGGPNEGFFPIDGPDSPGQWSKQKLVQKCGLINTPSVVNKLGF